MIRASQVYADIWVLFHKFSHDRGDVDLSKSGRRSQAKDTRQATCSRRALANQVVDRVADVFAVECVGDLADRILNGAEDAVDDPVGNEQDADIGCAQQVLDAGEVEDR